LLPICHTSFVFIKTYKKMMNLQASAIICAYNEEKTILPLLKEVHDTQAFDEIIVINDGSEDKTGKLIKDFKTQYDIIEIHLQKNKGKGFAMAKAAKLSQNEYLVFIDADLSNFNKEHAHQLLYPILKGDADMVLGQASKTLIHNNINPFKSLSGQRSLRKTDLLAILKKMESVGYGVETLINGHFKAHDKKVKYVVLKNLFHPTKFQKEKPHIAIKSFMMEAYQIAVIAFSNIIMFTK